MRPERLIYTFISIATHYNEDWGRGTPTEGVDVTAELAHKHGIPVTWIVNPLSIPVLADRIRQWHEQYGDDVILQCPLFGKDIPHSKDVLRRTLQQNWEMVTEAFPWAGTKVAARGGISGDMIEVLEELGFEGLWGYCWDQVWWDGITHKGIPWGSWYVDGGRYKVPHPGKGKIVACEWTARDLHQTYHTGSPCIYSTDPNDVLRAGLCTGENIEYWKKLFDDYLMNTENNEYVFFHQQQESHEMELTPSFSVWPASDIEASVQMLDRFFEYITKFPITATTLPKAVKLYHERNQVTAPSYMLTRDSRIRPAANAYTMTMGGVGCGPWPQTFLYYDTQCQMAFVKGECRPRLLRNYIGQWNMDDPFEEEIPPVFVTQFERTNEEIQLTFKFGYWKPIPFGLAYWDDLTDYHVKRCSDEVEVRIIQNKLAFLRFNLDGRKRTIELVLSKK